MPRQARSIGKGTDTSVRGRLIHVSVQISRVRHSGEAAYCLHAVVFEIKSKTLQMYGTQRSEVRLPVHIITGSGTALLYYVKNTVPQPPLSPEFLLVKLKIQLVCDRTHNGR